MNKWNELGPIDLHNLIKQLPSDSSEQVFGQSHITDQIYGMIDLSQPTKVTGIGRHVFPSGNTYEGIYQKDKRHGFGRLIWNDGAYYVGLWKNDKRNGKGTFVHANGDIEEGDW